MAERFVAYNSFVHGYNDTVPPDNMLDTELRKCDNAITYNRGGFEMRGGSTKFNVNSYLEEVNWIREWYFSDGSAKLIAVIGNDLCLVNEDGTFTVKLPGLASSDIGYVFYKDAMYFLDGDKYRVWGWIDYNTQGGTIDTLDAGKVVKNFPVSTGANPGVEGHFYKAKSTLSNVNLATENYGDASRWDDITNGALADHIIEVPPYNDSTNDLTPIKRCKIVEWHPTSLRFFFAQDSKDKAAVYYSEPDKPNFVKLSSRIYPTTSAGPVTGLKAMLKSMLVSYKRTWRVWNGITVGIDAEWKPLPIPYGCVSHDSIALTPNSLTFLAKEGICTIDPAILSDDVQLVVNKELFAILSDKKIENTIKSMKNTDKAKAVYHEGKYLLAYCDDADFGSNNKVLIMDWDYKGFNRITGWQVNSWCQRANGDLLFGSKNYILKAFDGLNDIDVETGEETPIAMDVLCKPYNCGSPNKKYLETLHITAQQYTEPEDVSSLEISLTSDYRQSYFLTDLNEALVWGRSWGKLWGFADVVNQYAVINKPGFRFQVGFKSNQLNNKLFVYSVGFGVNDLDIIDGDPMPADSLLYDET